MSDAGPSANFHQKPVKTNAYLSERGQVIADRGQRLKSVSSHMSNRIRFTAPEDTAQPEHPKERIAAACPAGKLIKDADVPVVLDWSVPAPPLESALKTRGGS